jgi:hypothetical protein
MNKSFLNRSISITGIILSVGFFIWVGLGLQGCGGGTGFFKSLTMCGADQEAFLDSQQRIGGASTVVTLLDPAGTWTLYNVANELRATQVGVTESAKYSLTVAGFIHDIDVVEYPASSGVFYALVSMGDKGIAVVNVTDPSNMLLRSRVDINYEQTGIVWTDGGGNIAEDNTISGMHAPISSIEVYDDGVTAHLMIGNLAYGIHKTLLSNLMDSVTEADGTLLIDSETYTLQYAGENPWGGPESMILYRDPTDPGDTRGKLFVAMGFLGMGIFDPDTLAQIGGYNLYTDTGSTEDWFIDNDVLAEVQSDIDVGGAEGASYHCTGPCIDANTGMPDFRQASYEITVVWHDKNPCPTDTECAPWAAFDRYGKYYYNARKVDVATFGGRTIAYIAYSLGGLQAVDVTGYKAPPGFLQGNRLGYAPAVPANGPDAPTGAQSKSLFPYFGAGMLKESGVVDVKVDVAGKRAFFSDHFAGLVAISGADDPAGWRGPNPPLVYDNDTLPGPGGVPVLGDHWPDYEFVTSYDMTPYDPTDNESLPTWLYQSPTLLLSGEVSGHGNSFVLMPSTATGSFATTGEVDVVMASGGGGISFIDVTDLTGNLPEKDGLDILVHMSTTDEIFREADGSLSPDGLSIGHTAGVAIYRDKLFVADGPHGMTVWQIGDAEKCLPIDDVHLLANTLQDEYPVTTAAGVTINPTPHAYDVVLDPARQQAYVLSQSRGLRRVDTAATSTGEIPVLLQVELSDIYEHNTDDGTSVGGLKMQDHAYDVALDGNLAFVADGSNGLTVFDIGQAPTVVVGNVGGSTRAKPLLGHATAVKLWRDNDQGRKYAFVASGHAGIGVVDVTDAANMELIKVFEPIKTEYHVDEVDGSISAQYNKADGKSVDVLIVDDHAYFTYDSFGVLAYRIADLIKPLSPQYAGDPTKIWDRGEIGDRPVAVARFKLQDPLLHGSAELSDLGGGAQGMFFQKAGKKHFFYVAYDAAGVAKIDWTDVSNPVLVQHIDTAGNAADVEVASARVFVADGGGGLLVIR